jgi:hypothetical protein
MLRAELAHIARHTHFPDRLQEIYRTLRNDTFLLEECFARQTLANRLCRNFFAFDGSLHSAARAEVEALHDRLANGEMDIDFPDPRRTVVAMTRLPDAGAVHADSASPSAAAPDGGPRRLDLTPEYAASGPARRRRRARWVRSSRAGTHSRSLSSSEKPVARRRSPPTV